MVARHAGGHFLRLVGRGVIEQRVHVQFPQAHPAFEVKFRDTGSAMCRHCACDIAPQARDRIPAEVASGCLRALVDLALSGELK
jgi:hypothetical protein